MATSELTVYIYGTATESVEAVREQLMAQSELEFQGGRSAYWGVYYTSRCSEDCKIIIQRNYDELHDELDEEDYPDCPVLIAVKCEGGDQAYWRTWLEAFDGIRFLRIDG